MIFNSIDVLDIVMLIASILWINIIASFVLAFLKRSTNLSTIVRLLIALIISFVTSYFIAMMLSEPEVTSSVMLIVKYVITLSAYVIILARIALIRVHRKEDAHDDYSRNSHDS